MTRAEFDKLDKIAESIKAARDTIKLKRDQRIEETNQYFDTLDAPLKEQYFGIVGILADATVEE